MSANVWAWQSAIRRPLSCSQSSQTTKIVCRQFGTSVIRNARETDFYRTLDIGKGASQREIKAQFYKLSKKWHPDVNQGSEESKVKFQEVSEAYATLGHEQSRKQYDRQMSDLGFGAGRGGVSRAGFAGTSDNLQRRATASYAWEYQRRNAARAQRSANRQPGGADSHYHHGGGGGADGGPAAFGWGTGGAQRPQGSNNSMFERLAEQQRRREAAANARSNTASAFDRAQAQQQSTEHDLSAGHFLRFLQITAMFGAIAFITSAVHASSNNSSALVSNTSSSSSSAKRRSTT